MSFYVGNTFLANLPLFGPFLFLRLIVLFRVNSRLRQPQDLVPPHSHTHSHWTMPTPGVGPLPTTVSRTLYRSDRSGVACDFLFAFMRRMWRRQPFALRRPRLNMRRNISSVVCQASTRSSSAERSQTIAGASPLLMIITGFLSEPSGARWRRSYDSMSNETTLPVGDFNRRPSGTVESFLRPDFYGRPSRLFHV